MVSSYTTQSYRKREKITNLSNFMTMLLFYYFVTLNGIVARVIFRSLRLFLTEKYHNDTEINFIDVEQDFYLFGI